MIKPDFIASLGSLGSDYASLPDVLEKSVPAVGIRLNVNRLSQYGISEDTLPQGRPVIWEPAGRLLPERPQFTLDPALHQGLYYVQDPSSMAQSAAVRRAVAALGHQGRPLRFLDACAAPGGKTIGALDALPHDAFVVANEADPRRAAILSENLAKWGRSALVTNSDATAPWRLDGFFDIIAADVPCSGEGMMRKDPTAAAQWSPALVAQCAALQRRILMSLIEALAPGGVLVYSTCTFNTTENEAQVAWLIENYGFKPLNVSALDTADGVLNAARGFSFPAYRFLPGRVEGEGQFICVLQKPEDEAHSVQKTKAPKRPKPVVNPAEWLRGEWAVDSWADGSLHAIPAQHMPLYDTVSARHKVRAAGLHLGQMKGHDFIAAQPIALSLDLRPDAFPRVDVDRQTALNYLRRHAISLPDGSPRGLVLLWHGAAPLGFVKNLGSRANNLYPTNWSIQK